MSTGIVLRQMLRERRRGLLWWSLGIGALAFTVVASYPSVRDAGSAFDEFMEELPEGVLEMMGAAGGITSPSGYMNSQFYSNIFPIMLLIFGIGVATWSIAGAEREGTLEPLLANPVHRWRVALERFSGVAVLLAVATLFSTVLLIALRAPFELDALSAGDLTAAGAGSFLLALLFAAISFAVGAATGSKAAAIAAGAGLATVTYLLFGLSSLVDFFESIRWASPWYWFLQPSPLTDGWTFQAMVAPLLVIIAAVAIGTAVFMRRDLRP